MSGQLCLKWNNHSTAFNKLLNNLHMKEMYSDGTLVCQGKFYPVHRFVLSTCSDYFDEIFSRCTRLNNKHPFIIVKDINPDQIEALLNYMYKGEVNVPQEMLPELIKAAEAFQIKGLAVPDEEPMNRPSKRRANVSSPAPQSKKSRKYDDRNKSSDNNFVNLNSDVSHNDNSDNQSNDKGLPSSSKDASSIGDENIYSADTEANAVVKSEPIDVIDMENDVKSSGSVKEEQSYDCYADSYDPFNENEDDHGVDDNFDSAQPSTWDPSRDFEGGDSSMEGDPSQRVPIKISDGVYDCFMCEYKCKQKRLMERHMRRHTGERPFSCHLCSYRATQNENLVRHLKTHTNQRNFLCHLCPYKAIQKTCLNNHLRKQHSQSLQSDLPNSFC